MKAFISYSHKDEKYLELLQKHMTQLKRDGLIDSWHDRDILAGSSIDDEIDQSLKCSSLFLLLVSPDFIASNYCYEREMTYALERHKQNTGVVVPIIVEPCDWQSISQLQQLKALPKDGKPVSEWTNPNNAYVDVIQELRRLANGFNIAEKPPNSISTRLTASQKPSLYRIQKDFDEIDKSDFLDKAFAEFRSYFQATIAEIDTVDGIKARFINRNQSSFGATVINQAQKNGVAHITVNCRAGQHMLGDISYSFKENAPDNTANGWFSVASDQYELYLDEGMSSHHERHTHLSPNQAAVILWNQFIEHAGITNA